VVFAFGGLSAQAPAWQPSPRHTQVPIWPRAVPDAQPVAVPEYAETVTGPRISSRAGRGCRGTGVAACDDGLLVEGEEYGRCDISTHFPQRAYAPVEFELNPEIPVTARTPPTFLL
jgi:hypothetical protein